MNINNKTLEEINVPYSLSLANPKHAEYFDIQTYPIRHLYVKIEVLNQQDECVAQVSGSAIDGSYNISATSIIRRTTDINFILQNGYLPNGNDSLFWINKKIHLFVGLANIELTKIYWFDKGIYAIQDPQINIAINNETISISGLDKMALYSGDITGQSITETLSTVESGVTKKDMVQALMIGAGELESNIVIQDMSNLLSSPLPYDIETEVGSNITDILDKVIETLANYQYYYDVDGKFYFCPKPTNGNYLNSNIEWDFEQRGNITLSINRTLEYSNVKNRITVWGGTHDDGYQPSYTVELRDDNPDFGHSPFTIEKLGETYLNGSTMYRDYVEKNEDYVDVILPFETDMSNEISYPYNICVEYNNTNNVENNTYYICKNKNGTTNKKGLPTSNIDDWEKICTQTYLEEITDEALQEGATDEILETLENYMQKIHAYSIELCRLKTEELLFNYYLASDKISITCVPIYSLDVNNVIIVNDEKSGAVGYYVVEEISCQLGIGGTMTITASKLF